MKAEVEKRIHKLLCLKIELIDIAMASIKENQMAAADEAHDNINRVNELLNELDVMLAEETV